MNVDPFRLVPKKNIECKNNIILRYKLKSNDRHMIPLGMTSVNSMYFINEYLCF